MCNQGQQGVEVAVNRDTEAHPLQRGEHEQAAVVLDLADLCRPEEQTRAATLSMQLLFSTQELEHKLAEAQVAAERARPELADATA